MPSGPNRGTTPPHFSQSGAANSTPTPNYPPLLSSSVTGPAILQSLLDHASEIVSLYNLDARLEFVNRLMPGMQTGDIVGLHITELVPAEYRTEVIDRFNRVIRTGQPEPFVTPGVGPNGFDLAYRGRVIPVMDQETVVAILVVVTGATDVVEQRQSELHARWYTRLVEHIDLGLYVVQLEPTTTGYTLRNISMNPAAERLTGVRAADWVGRTIDECFPALRARGVVEMAVRVVETGDSLEIGHFQHEESKLPGTDWSFSMFPLLDQHVGVMFADISPRKRVERQTRRMLDELARVSRISTMREMASGLAHELNQPLAAIVAYVDACLELVGTGRMDNQQLAGVLRSVSGQAERAGRIIHRLRQMIKRDQPCRAVISINDVVGETAVLLETAARQAGVTIHMELGADLPEVLADFVQIQQVVFNLVHNAIDAMADVPQNRRELTVTTSRISAREIEMVVRDLGRGLTEESAARLFEPFFSTSSNGLGLGLSISRTIIEGHGGRIDVSPNAEAGVTARFTLPVNNEKAAYVSTADSVHR